MCAGEETDLCDGNEDFISGENASAVGNTFGLPLLNNTFMQLYIYIYISTQLGAK